MECATVDRSRVSRDDAVAFMSAVGTVLHALKKMHSDQDEIDHGASVVLSVLYRIGPQRPSEIAQATGLDLSTVSRHARFQEEAGRAVKVADPADRRAHRLALTPDGIEHIHQMWNRRLDQLVEVVGHWDAEDIRTLTSLTERLAGDLGQKVPHEFPDPELVRTTHAAAIAESLPKGA
jgi:DNA-binding MarR family transcriptional regulator